MEINGRTAYRLDDKNSSLVCFWEEPKKNEYASTVEGRPIFDIALMGEIRTPGAKMSVFGFEIERRLHGGGVKQRINERSQKYVDILSAQLKAWREQNTATDLSGTPLETWPRLDVAMIASLRASGIFSIEALADVPDSSLDVLGMDGRKLREQAKAYIAQAKDSAAAQKYAVENDALKQRLAALEAQFAELSKDIPNDLPEEKRGPGRPRKAA